MEQPSTPEPTAPKAGKEKPPRISGPAQDDPLRRFSDLPIEVSVQLDRKLVSVREVLDLKAGSVVKMDRSAGENVDLLLDGVVMGNGEIVVIEDMMGLRITDLGVSPAPPKHRHG